MDTQNKYRDKFYITLITTLTLQVIVMMTFGILSISFIFSNDSLETKIMIPCFFVYYLLGTIWLIFILKHTLFSEVVDLERQFKLTMLGIPLILGFPIVIWLWRISDLNKIKKYAMVTKGE